MTKKVDHEDKPTKQQILEATRKQVEELIEKFDLDINPKDYDHAADLKMAVAEIMWPTGKKAKAAEEPDEGKVAAENAADGLVRFEVALKGNQTRIVRAPRGMNGQAVYLY